MNDISPIQIIVVHDDIDANSPIMVELNLLYKDENVHLFKHSKEGLDYILANLGQKMIVLLDKNFYDGKEMSGVKVFEKIREQTSLVYVILITVSKITEIDDNEIKMLINKDLFKYESFTSDYSKILTLVKEAELSLSIRIDAVIEEWIMRHDVDKREMPLVKLKDGTSYSMNDILQSIRQQTEIGVNFEKQLLTLAIELFSRQKIKIDD